MQTAFLALVVLAGAALLQAVALVVLGVSIARAARRLDGAVSSAIDSVTPALMRLGRALADVDGATRLLSQEAARTRLALETSRRDVEQAAAHAARDAHGMALSLRTMAQVTRSVEQGLEAYRQARPAAARPWHRAIDEGLAAYRSAKLRQPVGGDSAR